MFSSAILPKPSKISSEDTAVSIRPIRSDLPCLQYEILTRFGQGRGFRILYGRLLSVVLLVFPFSQHCASGERENLL